MLEERGKEHAVKETSERFACACLFVEAACVAVLRRVPARPNSLHGVHVHAPVMTSVVGAVSGPDDAST